MRAVLSRGVVVACATIARTKAASGLPAIAPRMALLTEITCTRDVHANLASSETRGGGEEESTGWCWLGVLGGGLAACAMHGAHGARAKFRSSEVKFRTSALAMSEVSAAPSALLSLCTSHFLAKWVRSCYRSRPFHRLYCSLFRCGTLSFPWPCSSSSPIR